MIVRFCSKRNIFFSFLQHLSLESFPWIPIYRIRYCRKQSQQLSTVSYRVTQWDGGKSYSTLDLSFGTFAAVADSLRHPEQHFEQIVTVVASQWSVGGRVRVVPDEAWLDHPVVRVKAVRRVGRPPDGARPPRRTLPAHRATVPAHIFIFILFDII